MRIAIFGEAMVEFDANFQRSFAGDTLNVAATTAKLGIETQYCMKIAEDIFYADFLKTFEKLKLNLSLVKTNGQNGLYFINNTADGERVFQYYRKNSAASQLHFNELPKEFFETDLIYNSGITAALSENCAQAVLESFKLAKSKSIMTAFDCNYRPALWDIESAHEFLKTIISYVDILFLSEDDLPVLKNLSHSFQIIRRGIEGSEVIKDGESKKYPALKVKAIDTTGAGDIYAGGFLAEYIRSKDIEKSAILATKLSSLQVQARGGLPSEEIKYE